MAEMKLEELGKREDCIPFHRSLIAGQASKTFLLKATGRGMEPEIYKGDLLFCEMIDPFLIKERDIVILYHSEKYNKNRFHCKRYMGTSNGSHVYADAQNKIFDEKGYEPIAKVKTIHKHVRR